MSDFIAISITAAAEYLLGSLPFAYWLARAVRGIGIRLAGSGNLGAVNVYRQVGRMAALTVLLLDGGKGAAEVFLPAWLGAPDVALYVAALTAAVGHNWSVFLGLRVGKPAVVTGVSFAVLSLLTALVSGTHFYRAWPSIVPAIREKRWLDVTSVEGSCPGPTASGSGSHLVY